jgi:hypothetical protein
MRVLFWHHFLTPSASNNVQQAAGFSEKPQDGRREGASKPLFTALSHVRILSIARGQRDPPRAPAQRGRPKKACRCKPGFETHALGRSKGGLGAKVHAATDALGNPVHFNFNPHHQMPRPNS